MPQWPVLGSEAGHIRPKLVRAGPVELLRHALRPQQVEDLEFRFACPDPLKFVARGRHASGSLVELLLEVLVLLI